MEDIVYFEVNNWTPDKDYPDIPQFTKWVGNSSTDDDWDKDTFCDDEYAKENELVISFALIDMSFNFCVCAKKSWVKNNCPSLLDEDKQFMAKICGGEPESRFGVPFLEYKPENYGVHHFAEQEGDDGYFYWKNVKSS